MANCKPALTPMAIIEKLSKESEEVISSEEAIKYRSFVGALQYLTLTSPNIAFSVNKVCQFL